MQSGSCSSAVFSANDYKIQQCEALVGCCLCQTAVINVDWFKGSEGLMNSVIH